jgi:hypothetical protein
MGYLMEVNNAINFPYDFCVGCSHLWVWVEDGLFIDSSTQNVRILVNA